MNPIHIHIQGFGPHSDTTIDFTKARGVTVIHGPTGTGKTTAIQAAFACLYGSFPDHGSIKDGLTANGNGHGSLTLTFEHGGKRYLAERQITPSKHDARLYETGENVEHRIIAGPKVRDMEAAVAALIGSKELALATWFCTRDGEGDLVTAIPSERRRVFGEMLDFDEFNRRSKEFGDEAAKIEAKAEVLEAQLAGSMDHEADIGDANDAIGVMEDRRGDLYDERERFEKRIADTEQAIRDASGDDEPLRAKIREHETAQHHLVEIETRLSALTREIEELDKRASGLAEAEDAARHVEGYEARLATEREKQEQFRAWQKWDSDRGSMERTIKALRESLTVIESAVGVDDKTRALAATIAAVEAEYKASVEANKKAQADNDDIRQQSAYLESHAAQIRGQIKRLEARNADRPKTPAAPEVCETCPLMKEFAGIPMEIERLRIEAERCDRERESLPAPAELIDLSEIARRGEKARAAKKQVEKAEENEASVERVRVDLEEKRGELHRHMGAKPVQCADNKAEIASIEMSLASARKVAARLEACRNAASDRVAKLADFATVEESRADAETAVESLKKSANDAREALTERESKTRQLRQELEAAKSQLPRINAHISECDAAIGAAKERIEAARRALEADEKKREEARALRLRVSDLRALRDCFGPKGFQPILIDQMVPALDTIADDILHRMSGGRLRMRWVTQKARKDGSVGEDLYILIRDERGERDASTASGGERQLLMAANRIALAIWLGSARGEMPRTLIFDEAGNNTDDEATTAFLEELGRVSDRFDSILLITPKSAVAEAVRSRIEMKPRFGGVDVTYSGN